MNPRPIDAAPSLPSIKWLWLPASALLLLTDVTADLTRQNSLDEAIKDHEWATAAELATRWHLEEPNKTDLLGMLALARIRSDDVERGEKILEEWEATLKEPNALAHELRGDLEHREKRSAEAVIHWTTSYGIKPSFEVAKKLSDRELWPKEEENRRKEWFLTLAKRYSIPKLQWEATQLSLEERDWDALLRYRDVLRTVTDRYEINRALQMAQAIDSIWHQQEKLTLLDQDFIDHPSPSSALRRAIFFYEIKMHQLALADALFAKEKAQGAMAARIVLGEVYRALKEYDLARELKAVAQNSLDLDAIMNLTRLDELTVQARAKSEAHAARARELTRMGQFHLDSNPRNS